MAGKLWLRVCHLLTVGLSLKLEECGTGAAGNQETGAWLGIFLHAVSGPPFAVSLLAGGQLGFLPTWQLREVGLLMWRLDALR